MEKSSPVKNSHGSKVTKNPLREWRGKWDLVTAAIKLDYCFFDYIRLENEPQNVYLDTDMIFHIQDVTRIPLETLVDYLYHASSVV